MRRLGLGSAWLAAALQVCSLRNDEEQQWHLDSSSEMAPPGATQEDSKPFGFLEPEPKDMQEVQLFASALVGGGERGGQVNETLAADPGSAAALLQSLAGELRMANDGSDRDLQAYNHLLELHFQERSDTNHASLSRGVIWQLADDIRRIERLRAMSADELAAVPEEETDSFVHFFRGLAKQKHGEGRAALAQGLMAAKRRAVIFTCSFGDGHKSAQQAVEDFLQAAGFVVEAVDTTHDPRFEDSLQRRLSSQSLKSGILRD